MTTANRKISSTARTVGATRKTTKAAQDKPKKGLLALQGILTKEEGEALTDHVSKIRGYRITTK